MSCNRFSLLLHKILSISSSSFSIVEKDVRLRRITSKIERPTYTIDMILLFSINKRSDGIHYSYPPRSWNFISSTVDVVKLIKEDMLRTSYRPSSNIGSWSEIRHPFINNCPEFLDIFHLSRIAFGNIGRISRRDTPHLSDISQPPWVVLRLNDKCFRFNEFSHVTWLKTVHLVGISVDASLQRNFCFSIDKSDKVNHIVIHGLFV